MAAGWPALAVVLFALAAPLLPTPGGGARADDDASHHHISWCLKKECKCTGSSGPADDNDNDWQQQVSVKCTYSGEKPVTLEQDKNSLSKWLVAVELCGDGRGKLTVPGRTFALCTALRSFNVSGFAEVTVQRQGLMVKNAAEDTGRLAVAVGRVGRLQLETNALQPTAGTADVLIEDCDTVQLGSEVITRLRSFALRRIGRLELSENTFKNAAGGSTIEKIILEQLTADKLPSNAFKTSIEHLSITNCTFNSIEENAFPVSTVVDVKLTNVTINRVKSRAFRNSLLINDLQIIGCHIQEMEEDAIKSSVHRVHIERSKFGFVNTSAVAVANELVVYNNTFDQVARHSFVLNNFHSVRVDGNTFGMLAAEAFFESSTVARHTRSELQVRDNVFQQPVNGTWLPVVRLQWAADDTNVTGNRFNRSCDCGPWRFVTVADSNDTADADDEFAERNYCRADAATATCANLTGDHPADLRIAEFQAAAGCDDDTAVYDACVKNLAAAAAADGGGILSILPNFTPAIERGIITTVVLLILCGFGVVCAVSAVTWLNARGYFIKLRSLLTTDGANGDGSSHGMSRTMSAHSLSPMSVHDYAELQRHKLGGTDNVRGGSEVGVRVIVYQDKGTQTVPEELTHEMLQELRVKLDDPEDYAEARGMIEHLYDLIRVEETCCSGTGWYSTGSLDDMTSTITTKAVAVGSHGGREQDVKSVGTNTPSLDRLCPPKMYMSAANAAGRHGRRPLQQQRSQDRSRRPPSVADYMDPADLLYEGGSRDEDADADIYSELTDLRGVAEDRPLPPVPNKPTTQV